VFQNDRLVPDLQSSRWTFGQEDILRGQNCGRNEIALVVERRPELVALIGRVWPEWGEVLTDLTASGLPPTPEGWGKLQDARRAGRLPTLPEQLNRRTAAALAAPHSKATLTERSRCCGDLAARRGLGRFHHFASWVVPCRRETMLQGFVARRGLPRYQQEPSWKKGLTQLALHFSSNYWPVNLSQS
jgi:hypothetical protein